ncbi:MAG: Flp pilus assembly complex ATPase component TadA [Firmicutes bacterium]|nr:Flp pilus assembly complex ATPase component TadA [Bacillota bacterium]
MSATRKRLGELLRDGGILTDDQLGRALEVQRKSDKRLGEILLDLGFADEEQIADALASHLEVPRVDLDQLVVTPGAITLIPEEFASRYSVFPWKEEDSCLHVAMTDPLDIQVIDDLRMLTGLNVKPYVATLSEIRRARRRHEDLQESADRVIKELPRDEAPKEEPTVVDSPGVQAVELILTQAVRREASDIHIEPQEDSLRVRYRLDGHLADVMRFPLQLAPDIISRVKVMADMDITEKRRPQDGRIELANDGVDMRVSSLPTIHGEKLVIRILNQVASFLEIDRLGFQPESMDLVRQMLHQPYGLILVTGPTGSGKTTTLYAFLNQLSRPERNVITVEDPVEFRLPGVNQVQVNPRAGLTFAAGLRAVLRQDPDVIMVGEVRDGETAEIAIRAALTGHLVLCTLHTNNTVGALIRLLDMGIEPYLLGATITGVLSQRLVRALCPRCKEQRTPDPVDLRFLGPRAETVPLYRERGCPFCNGTGFRGRLAIEEVLLIDGEIRQEIVAGSRESQLVALAEKKGTLFLRESGARRVLAGLTTSREVMRAVYTIDDSLEADREEF